MNGEERDVADVWDDCNRLLKSHIDFLGEKRAAVAVLTFMAKFCYDCAPTDEEVEEVFYDAMAQGLVWSAQEKAEKLKMYGN